MTFKHIKFDDSPVMRSFEKVAKERGMVEEESEVEEVVKKASAQEPALEATEDLHSDLVRLANVLREKGFEKDAEKLEDKIFGFKQAEKHLYKATDDGDVIESAHPDGEVEVAPSSGGYGVVETEHTTHKKILDKVLKTPTGKLASKAEVLVSQAEMALGINKKSELYEDVGKFLSIDNIKLLCNQLVADLDNYEGTDDLDWYGDDIYIGENLEISFHLRKKMHKVLREQFFKYHRNPMDYWHKFSTGMINELPSFMDEEGDVDVGKLADHVIEQLKTANVALMPMADKKAYLNVLDIIRQADDSEKKAIENFLKPKNIHGLCKDLVDVIKNDSDTDDIDWGDTDYYYHEKKKVTNKLFQKMLAHLKYKYSVGKNPIKYWDLFDTKMREEYPGARDDEGDLDLKGLADKVIGMISDDSVPNVSGAGTGTGAGKSSKTTKKKNLAQEYINKITTNIIAPYSEVRQGDYHQLNLDKARKDQAEWKRLVKYMKDTLLDPKNKLDYTDDNVVATIMSCEIADLHEFPPPKRPTGFPKVSDNDDIIRELNKQEKNVAAWVPILKSKKSYKDQGYDADDGLVSNAALLKGAPNPPQKKDKKKLTPTPTPTPGKGKLTGIHEVRVMQRALAGLGDTLNRKHQGEYDTNLLYKTGTSASMKQGDLATYDGLWGQNTSKALAQAEKIRKDGFGKEATAVIRPNSPGLLYKPDKAKSEAINNTFAINKLIEAAGGTPDKPGNEKEKAVGYDRIPIGDLNKGNLDQPGSIEVTSIDMRSLFDFVNFMNDKQGSMSLIRDPNAGDELGVSVPELYKNIMWFKVRSAAKVNIGGSTAYADDANRLLKDLDRINSYYLSLNVPTASRTIIPLKTIEDVSRSGMSRRRNVKSLSKSEMRQYVLRLSPGHYDRDLQPSDQGTAVIYITDDGNLQLKDRRGRFVDYGRIEGYGTKERDRKSVGEHLRPIPLDRIIDLGDTFWWDIDGPKEAWRLTNFANTDGKTLIRTIGTKYDAPLNEQSKKLLQTAAMDRLGWRQKYKHKWENGVYWILGYDYETHRKGVWYRVDSQQEFQKAYNAIAKFNTAALKTEQWLRDVFIPQIARINAKWHEMAPPDLRRSEQYGLRMSEYEGKWTQQAHAAIERVVPFILGKSTQPYEGR